MISIVIPVFNEEDNVISLYKSINEVMTEIRKPFEVIFVDDGSNDRTLLHLQKILANGDANGNLRILELQRNYGQTPALLAGLANIRGDLVVTMDGDLQNDPRDIPKMLDALTDEYDVICGWRKNRHDNIFKKIPSKFNNFLNKRLNDVDIHDSGCTLRLYRKEAVENLQLHAEGHRYIPAILAKQGFKLGEVETNHRPRTMGKTKYGFKRLFRGFIDLTTLNTLNKWGKKPSHLFSLWACIFFFTSFLCFTWALLEKFAFFRFWNLYETSIDIRSNSIITFSLLFLIFGILFILIGFVTELFLRKNIDSHSSYKIRKIWSEGKEREANLN